MTLPPSRRTQWYHWLKARTPEPGTALKRFTTGGFVFCAGLMVILLADALLTPSLQQEITTLLGLLLVALGSFVALMGYLAISLLRILLFILEPSHDRSDRH
ncbi:hypothetical protein [Saccharospirillum impatiens]|uniref:hypothetical protein n=1 Tax=Saccharospirillum impatiens TaxID=169438 RepID=UPI00056968F4|nr:hypothetical protein [Saccharospirillum impatiens]